MFAHSFAAFILILPALTAASTLPRTSGHTSNDVQDRTYNFPSTPNVPSTHGVPSTNVVPSTPTVNQCNTGPVQCCNEVQTVSSSNVAGFLGIIGFAVGAPSALIGHNCSPISALKAAAGASCTTQPVCCTNNNFNGLIVLGCSPIIL